VIHIIPNKCVGGGRADIYSNISKEESQRRRTYCARTTSDINFILKDYKWNHVRSCVWIKW